MLRTYRAKRNFDVTSEPRGKSHGATGNRFVIQKHAARRLHYDLRLELDGAMKSWAVTRGPSLVPGEKRLAVHVEDHPIEYNKFEGTIPKGEYGGGTVMIWDRGRWIPEGDPHAGYRKGHLSFRLEGDKLHGAWHLVRMRAKPGDRHEPWLLIKSDDEAARTAGDRDVLEEKPLSVATGRSLEEIAEGKPSSRRRVRAQTSRQSSRAGAPRKVDHASSTARRAPQHRARPIGKRAPALPDFIPPSLATLRESPPDDRAYVHEIKFDGYRMEARIDRGKIKLKTRRRLDWTHKFAPIASALGQLPVTRALMDGEIVSLKEGGQASFSQLQQDLKSGRLDRLGYFLFDLLHLDGRDLTALPLLERKDALRRLLADLPADTPLRFSEHFTEQGSVTLKHACRMGLEGIVSKRADAPYHPGRSDDWIKTKCSDRQEFVIAGYAPSAADPRAVGALLLAYHENGKLKYAGRTGTGFSFEVARDLWQRLQSLRTKQSPLVPIPDEERSRRPCWVEPRLVAEIAFHGWTHGERVRQSSFQGLREDKPASEIVRETAMPEPTSSAKPSGSAPAPSRIGDVQLTHPDRIYWEDAGINKRDLAQYYAEIWDWIGPHIVRRPISIVRCPEGSSSECFFQRHASAGVDASHLLATPRQDGKSLLAVDDLDGLIALVQAGALELHVWGTTIDHLADCDRLVFDLDPAPGVQWSAVVDAAREVRERLSDLGLQCFLKTTGGKGLHVVVPIVSTPWSVAKPFARSLAIAMAADAPSRYLAKSSKEARRGRIFVDYLRNDRTASSILAYSTRARPGAPVSTPLSWEELGSQSGPNHYTLLNVRGRLARLRRDPWGEIGRLQQHLQGTTAPATHEGAPSAGRAKSPPARKLRRRASRLR